MKFVHFYGYRLGATHAFFVCKNKCLTNVYYFDLYLQFKLICSCYVSVPSYSTLGSHTAKQKYFLWELSHNDCPRGCHNWTHVHFRWALHDFIVVLVFLLHKLLHFCHIYVQVASFWYQKIYFIDMPEIASKRKAGIFQLYLIYHYLLRMFAYFCSFRVHLVRSGGGGGGGCFLFRSFCDETERWILNFRERSISVYKTFDELFLLNVFSGKFNQRKINSGRTKEFFPSLLSWS